MDSQPYNMVYYDKNSHTLEDATRVLQHVSNTILRYKQIIFSAKLYEDVIFANHIRFNQDHGVLHLSFPPKCRYITNMRSNCKMVLYHDNKEVRIKPHINLLNEQGLSITVYTNPYKNTLITFNVYIVKELQSAL